MSKQIIFSGSNVSVVEVDRVESKLPVGNYNIGYNSMTGQVFLTKMPDLKLPDNEFIDTSIADVWLKSFSTYDSNLGVLLSGLKGAGKTVLAKKTCVKSGLPILHLNSPIPVEALSMFLADPMFHNCIVFIDEFEKTINQRDEHIASWLKLMDGGFNTKLFFLITSNGDNISEFLMNRLGRIKYRKHFSGLSPETIDKIIDSFLVNQEFKQDLVDTSNKISLLSIDILVNIIQEINLFNEPASVVVSRLNIVNQSIGFDVFELYEGEWKPCGYKHFDISEIDEEDISRGWLREIQNEMNHKINDLNRTSVKRISDYSEVLTKEEIKLLGLRTHHYFDKPSIEKTKEGYIVKEDGLIFKFAPCLKSNMLF